MKIAVIGLGSMGKRRIRLMKDMYPTFRIVGIDGREDRRIEAIELFDISCFPSLDEVDEKINCAFICTSPLSHSEIITDCLERGYHVFTELNLVSNGYDKNMELSEKKKLVLFLSSTFFYREESKYIQSKIATNRKWNYIYHIGQYLPDWHPWENYQDFFIGDKQTNGCREIMAIEFPWITGTFGEIESTYVVSDRITNLKIDFNDNYMIQVTHKNGNKGILIVDVVSPIAVRRLEAYAENAYIAWNGTPDSIMEFEPETKSLKKVILTEVAEHKSGYSTFIVENAYRNEIKEFFDVVSKQKEPLYDFKKDKKILDLIDSLGA